MRFDAYIFDLDGTLLDTLPDLTRLTNIVLAEHGWPPRTYDEILSFVGNGGRVLMGRAAPEGTPDEVLDEMFERWRHLFRTEGHTLTHPYDGTIEMLEKLKARGVKLGVLSNKFDAAAKAVIEEHFSGTFDLVRGEGGEIPRKPDPAGLQLVMRQLDVAPERTVYIGDSSYDVEVAHNAGTFSVAVSWGYRSVDVLASLGPDVIIYNPGELLNIER